MPGAVAAGRAPAGQLAQPGHLGVAGRDREVGQAGRDQLQVEGQGPAELGGQLDRPRVAGQAGRLLEPGPQMGAGPGGQPAVQVGQGAAGPDRGQRGGQPAPSRGRVVDVVGRHHLDPGPVGQPDQGVVADRVERVAMVPDLHVEVAPPERLDEPVQLGLGRRRPPLGQRAGHRPLPAPGQHRPVPAVQPGQPPQLPLGRPFGPGHLRLRDRPAQPRIPLRPPRQHHQMLPARVGRPRPPRAPGDQRQLGAEDGRQAQRPCRLGEADDAVHAVVVGDGQRLQAKVRRLLRQLLRVRAAVQEARVRVAVQLGIRDHHPPPPARLTRAG